MKFGKWLCSVWAEMTAPQPSNEGVEVIFRLVVKKADSGFIVTPVGCQKPEEHSAEFKRVGDHYELGEVGVEEFGKCVLARVIRHVAADATIRVELVDDHTYGFACGPDGCKPFFA